VPARRLPQGNYVFQAVTQRVLSSVLVPVATWRAAAKKQGGDKVSASFPCSTHSTRTPHALQKQGQRRTSTQPTPSPPSTGTLASLVSPRYTRSAPFATGCCVCSEAMSESQDCRCSGMCIIFQVRWPKCEDHECATPRSSRRSQPEQKVPSCMSPGCGGEGGGSGRVTSTVCVLHRDWQKTGPGNTSRPSARLGRRASRILSRWLHCTAPWRSKGGV
jgi:hypothetical protein